VLPHGWFIGFAPADKPRIAFAILVEHGGSGGEAAAPVAHELLARFFHMAPAGEGSSDGVTDTEG
jgi:cell division protein FtsI/penicillin-binding protein 2